MVHQPVEFPFDAAREVVRIFKSNSAAAERQLLAESIWNLQGYAQFMLLGNPETPTIFKADPPSTDEEIIQTLEEFDKGATSVTPRLHFPFEPQKLLDWCLNTASKVI